MNRTGPMSDDASSPVEADVGVLEARLHAGRSQAVLYLLGAWTLVWCVLWIGWDDVVSAWPGAASKRPGVSGLALGVCVMSFAAVFLVVVSRRYGGGRTKRLCCPLCGYAISESWDRPPASAVRCHECGGCFWMAAYMAVAAPSARVYAWAVALRRRPVVLATGAIVAAAGSGVATGALVAPWLERDAFNIGGVAFAGAAIGLAAWLAIVDIAMLRLSARWARSTRCPFGHDGAEHLVGVRRTIVWCETCHDGWWRPTHRDAYLRAVVEKLRGETDSAPQEASADEPA